MPVHPQLRSLQVDVPSQPDALLKLSLLLREEQIDLRSMAALIEADMALAAAVLKAVNSSLYGLPGRVASVQQAIGYLGLREVAGITYEMGLRAAFGPAPELEPLWQRAATRGWLMAQLAVALQQDAWAAHSAGLFEECGKAVLLRHAPQHYPAMLRAATTDAELCSIEHTAFGVSHDALGAALCESWGLGAAAVLSVRHHVQARADAGLLGRVRTGQRGIAALSLLAAPLLAPRALQLPQAAVAAAAGWEAEQVQMAVEQAACALAQRIESVREDAH